MDRKAIKADALLLLTATLWGFAFVAQRIGMEYIGPFTFNGIRFALGSLSLLPLIRFLDAKERTPRKEVTGTGGWSSAWKAGLSLGFILFGGASLQQVGLVYTTAGKAGFITGLYVVMVPLLGLYWRQHAPLGTWIGAILSSVGLYFLSMTGTFQMETGDFLVLLGAFFWAIHVILVGRWVSRLDPIRLACLQFAACSALSLTVAVTFEPLSLHALGLATPAILYGGFVSVGIAYTLQVVAQKDAPPAHAAILLSMESPFAALGGWILLSETLSLRALLGCALMLSGMILSQLAELVPLQPKGRPPRT